MTPDPTALTEFNAGTARARAAYRADMGAAERPVYKTPPPLNPNDGRLKRQSKADRRREQLRAAAKRYRERRRLEEA